MSKADEMFERLLYRKNYEDNHRVNYESLEKDTALCPIIDFDKDFKEIRIWNSGIGIEELQAINEKVKELRMDRRRKKTTYQGIPT